MKVPTALSGERVCCLNSRHGLVAKARSEVMMEVATAPQRGVSLLF